MASTPPPPTGLVIVADGAEEMETVITVDVLRRAGIDVTVAGLSGKQPIKCSRGICIVPDVALDNVVDGRDGGHTFDAVILPGGLAGAQAMAASELVGHVLSHQQQAGRLIGAICAAPVALLEHRIGLTKRLTSHPSKADELRRDYQYVDDQRVVVDGQLVTSRGPGTTFEFALAIVDKLLGPEKVTEISGPMVLK
ncbi:protein dj-1beta-like [Oppia nitens]|uniref:protein dj-1beta-like n=1 Tax=Oppia nitens TaxID=1686743 RepID=UPI0023DA587C|nr:protein dj-1beta-like [Oppia nitens]